MILTEEEIKNLMTTYHGNDAFVIGVAVGKSIEVRKWISAHNGNDSEVEEFVKYMED